MRLKTLKNLEKVVLEAGAERRERRKRWIYVGLDGRNKCHGEGASSSASASLPSELLGTPQDAFGGCLPTGLSKAREQNETYSQF